VIPAFDFLIFYYDNSIQKEVCKERFGEDEKRVANDEKMINVVYEGGGGREGNVLELKSFILYYNQQQLFFWSSYNAVIAKIK
jgi:hypothetical protein